MLLLPSIRAQASKLPDSPKLAEACAKAGTPPFPRSTPPRRGSIRFRLALRTYAPWGVHRTCGQPNEIKKNTHRKNALPLCSSPRAGKKWRFGYLKHLKNGVKASCHSKGEALAIAEAGLDHMYNTFEFVRPDGESVTFAEEMTRTDTCFHIGVVEGEGHAQLYNLPLYLVLLCRPAKTRQRGYFLPCRE